MNEHGFTSDQTEAVERTAAASAHRVLRNYTRRALIGFFLLLVGVGYAINGNTQTLKDSHERGQKVRTVICTILTESDYQAYAFTKKHNLNAESLQASLKATAHYREEVGPAPGCNGTITPPPTSTEPLD